MPDRAEREQGGARDGARVAGRRRVHPGQVLAHPGPDGTKPFDYARSLGVTRLRTNVLWSYTLPPSEYRAKKKPAVLHYDFSVFDRLIDRAAAAGIRVHVSLTGPAPRWANARHYGEAKAWFKPNATEFGEFASVAAQHFKGRVDRYSIWNEPNWKTWLGP